MADPDSYLGKMFSKTETKTPDEIADYLEHDNEVRKAITKLSEAACSTQRHDGDTNLSTHKGVSCLDGRVQLEETHSSAADAGQSEVRVCCCCTCSLSCFHLKSSRFLCL